VSVTFPRPVPDEANGLAALHVRFWQESYAALLDWEFLRNLPVSYRADMLRQAIADPAMFPEVAEFNGDNVGVIITGPAGAHCRPWADGEIFVHYLS
jgi:hypothetical protein